MKVKVINSSSKKTRNKIKSSFAILLKEKRKIKNITINELVNKAEITRGTFYTHYDNIYEVAKEFQDELLDVLFSEFNKIKTYDDIKNYLSIIFKHLEDNEELYKMMLSSDEVLLFTNRLSKIMKNNLCEFLSKNNVLNKDLSINFFVDGTINLFIKYFREEINVSLEELYNYIINICKVIFKEIK